MGKFEWGDDGKRLHFKLSLNCSVFGVMLFRTSCLKPKFFAKAMNRHSSKAVKISHPPTKSLFENKPEEKWIGFFKESQINISC